MPRTASSSSPAGPSLPRRFRMWVSTGRKRHQDEVVGPHLHVEAGHTRHVDADQDAGPGQLLTIAQALDGVLTDLEMRAGFDDHQVGGDAAARQLREVISDDGDLVSQT